MTVKTYLPLEEARAIIVTDGKAWEHSAHQQAAHLEGWNIFNLEPGRTDPLTAGIEKYSFVEDHEGCTNPIDAKDDVAVEQYCARQAAEGSETHAVALRIHHALDSLRYHLWGEDWVDSRMGPDIAA